MRKTCFSPFLCRHSSSLSSCIEFAINLLLQSERNVAISLTLNTDQPVRRKSTRREKIFGPVKCATAEKHFECVFFWFCWSGWWTGAFGLSFSLHSISFIKSAHSLDSQSYFICENTQKTLFQLNWQNLCHTIKIYHFRVFCTQFS